MSSLPFAIASRVSATQCDYHSTCITTHIHVTRRLTYRHNLRCGFPEHTHRMSYSTIAAQNVQRCIKSPRKKHWARCAVLSVRVACLVALHRLLLQRSKSELCVKAGGAVYSRQQLGIVTQLIELHHVNWVSRSIEGIFECSFDTGTEGTSRFTVDNHRVVLDGSFEVEDVWLRGTGSASDLRRRHWAPRECGQATAGCHDLNACSMRETPCRFHEARCRLRHVKRAAK